MILVFSYLLVHHGPWFDGNPLGVLINHNLQIAQACHPSSASRKVCRSNCHLCTCLQFMERGELGNITKG